MAPRDQANKFLCKICNIWIADNKPQREQHENGRKHKAAKVKLLKEIAKKNDASRRAAGMPILSNTAAQQMLESVALATKVENATENAKDAKNAKDEGVDKPKKHVDHDAGFPLPADQVYAWRDVDDGAEVAQDDYMTGDALGEFAPDVEEEETCVRANDKEGNREDDKDEKNNDKSISTVAENEDPEERKALESLFKKRTAPKNRRKRRAR